MCVGEMAQLMEPVRAVPTVRCSAKVKYCTKVREWERISISRENVRKETCQSSKPAVGSVESLEKRKSKPAILPLQRREPMS